MRIVSLRIVSLLPSATEIICMLGLEDQLVGVTHECDYPDAVRQLPKVTRTLIPTDASSGEIDRLVRERLKDRRALYSLDMAAIEPLRPDLIVTQALCDVCAVAEDEVRAAAHVLPGRPRVINLEPQTLGEVLACIKDVAVAAGVPERATPVIATLQARVDAVTARNRGRVGISSNAHPEIPTRPLFPRVALLEWLDPPFSCGHWNPELVRLAGGVEGLGREGERSRTLTWQDVAAWNPEVIVIACCGFGVERTIVDVEKLQDEAIWRELDAVRNGRVHVVDGSHYFSRPGPRLVDSLEILASALHPDIHPLPAGIPGAFRLKAE